VFGASPSPAVRTTGGAGATGVGGGAAGGSPPISGGTNPQAGAATTTGGISSSSGGSAPVAPPAAGSSSTSTGGSTATGAPAAPACTRKAGALRGASPQTVTVAGVQRSFVYYAPPELDPSSAAPVVIVAHGWTMTGQQMVDLTHYQALADREGFVALFPDGQPLSIGPWNVGNGACPSSLGVLPLATGDDQAFIDAMLAFTESDRCVERRHLFVTGFSMGGYFSNETGCLRSDIAGVAPHSGGSHDLSACPVERKPVILFHGTMDGLIPVTCGKEARDRWVEHNGCSAEVDTVDVLGGHCEYSKGCPAGGQVALCLFDGMDHGWAGGNGAYGFPSFEPATELSWSFFRRYAWD
jgi:polyhydroxybutyrate depolymerase